MNTLAIIYLSSLGTALVSESLRGVANLTNLVTGVWLCIDVLS